jgi:SAM-dependent methyltransferase
VQSVAPAGASTSVSHVAEDDYLSAFYELAYSSLSKIAGSARPDRTIEIGAGLGLSTLSGKHWIMSDVTGAAPLTLLNFAEALPYKDASLDAIVLKDTWHHIPDIEAFLREAHRVLRPGGVIAVFDPYWSVLGRFVYRFLHQERWDASTESWSFSSASPWDSNQALSYLMLKRDRRTFDQRWGNRFSLIEPKALVGPSFLLSGGVSRRTFVSGRWLATLLRWEERRGVWFNHFRFFHVFGLVKQ